MVSKKKPQAKKSVKGSRVQLSAEVLPRHPLSQAEAIAQILHSMRVDKPSSWDHIAAELNIRAKSGHAQYLLSSALAYGIINRETGNLISLSETGRKIVAPLYEGEDIEGRTKATLRPTFLSKFFSDYNGHPLPPERYFPNVLQTRYGIPENRVNSAIKIILENGAYAGILEFSEDGQIIVRLSNTRTSEQPPMNIISGEDLTEIKDRVAATNTDWAKICFYITPIGDEGTEVRKHSDMMLKHLLEPVIKENFGLTVVRADKIDRSGIINQQVFEHLVKANLCVADLSFSNPNAFYELGVRHICKLPTIQIIRKGDKIPFDVAQGRTITVDTSDVYTVMDRFESARRELAEHMKHLQSSNYRDGGEGNPVAVYLPGLKLILPK